MRNLIAATLIAVLGIVSLSPAQIAGNCPDQRASAVPGAENDVLPYRHCMLSIHVLGVWISLSTGRCPTGHTTVAAHDECLGLYSPGHACEPVGSTAVMLSLCRCVPHVSQTGTWNRCECKSVGAIGFVANGSTIDCH